MTPVGTPQASARDARPINISKVEVAGGMTVATDGGYNNMNWGSNHPAGANFAMGDGSVTFVEDAIDMNLFMAAGSRASADSRALSLDWLTCDD